MEGVKDLEVLIEEGIACVVVRRFCVWLGKENSECVHRFGWYGASLIFLLKT
jgi:hypothetical protein